MTTPNISDKEEEKLFQTYSSTRQSWKTYTPTGRRMCIVDYKLITNNKEEIEYLNAQLEVKGLPWLRKGEKVTSKEADPMYALRERIRAEAVAAYKKEQKGQKAEIPDMGSTEQQKLNPASTSSLARLQAASNAAK